MILVTHADPYDTDPRTGAPRIVKRYGHGILIGRRVYGVQPGTNYPIRDQAGQDGTDTITAVMFDTGKEETFDVANVQPVQPTDNRANPTHG